MKQGGQAMTRKSRKVGPLIWRVKAYDGECLEHGSSLPLVAEISGKITKEASRPIQSDKAQRCLLAMVVDLNNRRSSRYPLTPFAQVGSSMTVCVEQMNPADDNAGEPIARLDLTREGNRAFASLLVAGQPRIDLEPVDIALGMRGRRKGITVGKKAEIAW
ncbi:hypothetical protein [Paraburkholderia sp. RL17-337-BIB-A]|uniref:hypothetical protein n=1 Tax=Paraburkholderia sp. RL17-337-BIB-A TaxID=3031636 RepID=UPI0038BA39E4